MISQILLTVLFMIGFSSILFFSEYLHKHFAINGEYTRKIAHILATLSSLILIFTIESHWYILFLGLVFFFLLFLGKRKGYFKSIDPENRKTAGSYLLPISIYIAFYISRSLNNDLIFILPVLLLGISDPLAGLFGVYFKSRTKNITIFNYQFDKTILGSGVFFISTLIITPIVLYTFDYEFLRLFILSIVIACTITVTELISPYGTDNLSVPLMTILILIV